MSKNNVAWYNLVDDPRELQRMIKCTNYASALSLEEMKEIRLESLVPMAKATYYIKDRAGKEVFEGCHEFDKAGVTSFTLDEILPWAELVPYETENVDYQLDIKVTLVTGDEIRGFRVFECNLRKGTTTTDLPKYDFLERLAAIPVAKPGMTEDELRQICVDYMKLQCGGFTYKFKEDFNYTIVAQKRDRILEGGKVYGGLPYITRGAGNLYRVAEFFDPETGELDVNGNIFQNIRHFGNACSGAGSTAWARVVTSAYLGYSMFMSEANGFLPVGPYRNSHPELTKFIKSRIDADAYNCHSICQENGEQVMFESYALMKPADGFTTNGHVMMNTSIPVVIRNEDGTIDGDQSYLLVTEQVCYVGNPNHIRIAPDGTHYTAQGAVDRKTSFRALFNSNNIPFTFAEFQDPSKVEVAKVRLAVEPELKMEVLSSNYPISDIFCEVNGKRYVFRNEEFFRKEVKMGDVFPEEALVGDVKVSVRLYNGETIEVDTRR